MLKYRLNLFRNTWRAKRPQLTLLLHGPLPNIHPVIDEEIEK